MDFDISKLTLIDLISEKHAHLRRTIEIRWEQVSDIHFSHAEWHLISKIEQKSFTISQAAVMLGISRQAMQKCVKKLEKQGYITSGFKDGNKRDKFLFLTRTGKEYCQQNNHLKIKMEQDLEQALGKDVVEQLKSLFQKDWLID